MRVVIAEDSVLLQAGLAKILTASGIEVAAAVGDAESLLAAVAEHQPDAVIADVRMPPAYTDEGIKAALVIRQQWPQVAVLVLSQYVEGVMPRTCCRPTPAGSGTCSRTGSRTLPSSWPRCAGWPAAARPSTRKWSRNCCSAGTKAIRPTG